ncbi:MAG TPA: hypothetical protein VN363_05450 [Anaerolineales bacterium]|nr:hypothetical protein [Anaerolineales bacterium]
MKRKTTIGAAFALLILVVVVGTVGAQYAGFSWTSVYQVVNMGDAPADITVSYFDGNGVQQTHQQVFTDVPSGSSRLVVQFTDDTALGSGLFSAVVAADQPVAAIANLQLVPDGATSYNPAPPFGTYSAEGQGSTSVILPAVMYNWYNYYTEVYIMNVGTGAASVDIEYIPGVVNGVATGTALDDLDNAVPQYASLNISQQAESGLGAPPGAYAGRFLGSAILTSDQPIIAIVNQHNVNDSKLMTYNGFTDGGSLDVAAPVHMRGYYGYYSTLLVANPSTSAAAHVEITYTPDLSRPNVVSSGSIAPVTVPFTIDPQTSLTRHDGPTATDVQSDLDDTNVYTRFFGSVRVTSDIPVVVLANQEALAATDAQGGSYNGAAVSTGTAEVVIPVIMADYYGYYTTTVVQNMTGTDGVCDITYTSDGTYSSVKNLSETYHHELPGNGAFTIYEGRKGGVEDGDINADDQWIAGDGTRRFLGAATMTCDVDVVSFVNEEKDILLEDSMYTYNAFNK